MSAQTLLLQYAKRYPRLVVASVVLGLAGALFNGIGTTLIVPAVFALLNRPVVPPTIDLPPLLSALVAPFAGLPEDGRAAAMLGFIVLAIVLKNLANYLSLVTSEQLTRKLTQDFRKEGLRLLLEVDLSYHNALQTGDIIQRLNDQVGLAVMAVGAGLGLLRAFLNIVLFSLVLLAISWQLTGVAAVFFVGLLAINRVTVNRARHFGGLLSEASKQYSVRTLEMLNGIRLVKASATERQELSALYQLVENREAAALQSQMNAAVVGPLNEVLSIVALVGLILVSQLWLGTSVASATLLLTFLVVLSRVIQFVGQLNTARSRLASSAASIERVYDFLRRDDKTFMAAGHRPMGTLQRGIRFEQVTFYYPNAAVPALVDITLDLAKGQTLALVGASGAGKSTLADLLPRFYDPTAGRILVDGVDLREFDLGSLRRSMGIVSQDTFLFNATVRDNITYGLPQATAEDMRWAATQAHADEFIAQLPQGFDTLVGDRGVLLSGGQRQRLAIARALLQNPPILILDEATSALDSVSEQLVQEAIDQLSQNRTTLVIAHRLSTIRKANLIAVLEHGRLVELGSHEHLLQQRGRYANFYRMQFVRDMGRHGLGNAPEAPFPRSRP